MRHTLTMLLTLLSAAATLPAQQVYLSKEYIRAAGNTLAVESYLDLSLSTAVNVTQANPWYVVASADLNRDGTPDLIWQQNASSGWIQVWFLTGTDGTELLTAANIATTPLKVVAAADFNGDGTPDLLLEDTSTGAVTVWYLTVSGNPTAGYTITYTTASVTGSEQLRVVGAADFNGDGHPDIVWQNPANGAVLIWYMNGITQTSFSYVVTSSSLSVVGTQDFNGDGVPDLVMQSPTTGLLQVWFMAQSASGTVLGSTTVTTSNPWRVKAAAYNGAPYFIWESPTTGWVQYWFESDL